MNQLFTLQEILLILDDAIDVCSDPIVMREAQMNNRMSEHAEHVLELVAKRKAVASEMHGLRDKRLKRFSLTQLNLRLGKLDPHSQERLDILFEIQFRSN